MTATPLILGEAQKRELRDLRKLATEHPIHMPDLVERITTPEGKQAHMAQMNTQTIAIPLAFLVTFSIETGHPCGTCRHMSMSSERRGRLPTPEAVWMICEELGFMGSLQECQFWFEDLQRGMDKGDKAKAVNVVQPVSVQAGIAPLAS